MKALSIQWLPGRHATSKSLLILVKEGICGTCDCLHKGGAGVAGLLVFSASIQIDTKVAWWSELAR